MKLFETPGADAAYDRWLNPPDNADDSSDASHEIHVKYGYVIKNALLSPRDYPCCVEEFLDLKEARLLCSKHPLGYYEPEYAYCEECSSDKKEAV